MNNELSNIAKEFKVSLEEVLVTYSTARNRESERRNYTEWSDEETNSLTLHGLAVTKKYYGIKEAREFNNTMLVNVTNELPKKLDNIYDKLEANDSNGAIHDWNNARAYVQAVHSCNRFLSQDLMQSVHSTYFKLLSVYGTRVQPIKSLNDGE